MRIILILDTVFGMLRFKTVTYAMMHLVVAVGVVFALTQSWTIALGIGLIEPLVQTVFYALHERVWQRVGRSRGRAVTATPAVAMRV